MVVRDGDAMMPRRFENLRGNVLRVVRGVSLSKA